MGINLQIVKSYFIKTNKRARRKKTLFSILVQFSLFITLISLLPYFFFAQVDKVIGRRRTSSGKEEYLVHWKNYDPLYSTWEPVENLLPCLHTVTEFMAKSFPMPGDYIRD